MNDPKLADSLAESGVRVANSWMKAVNLYNAIQMGAILLHADGEKFDGKPFQHSNREGVRKA